METDKEIESKEVESKEVESKEIESKEENNSDIDSDTEIIEKEKSSDFEDNTEIINDFDNSEESNNEMDDKINNLNRRLSNLENIEDVSLNENLPLENVVIDKEVDLTNIKEENKKVENTMKKLHSYKSIDELEKCSKKEKNAAKCLLCPCIFVGSLMCYFGRCLNCLNKTCCCCINRKSNNYTKENN